MFQQHNATRPARLSAAEPAVREGGGVDPWASLSAEDDASAASALPASARVDDTSADVDPCASQAADANAAAVDAAIASAEIDYAPAPAASGRSGGGALTLPMLCVGIAVIAACLLIPQSDANRRLAYERVKLQADLEAVEKQVEVNDQFLRKVADDPNLSERLAQRQMKIIRKGNEVLALKSEGADDEVSPFQLTAVPAPPALPPYQPRGGALANLCYNPRSRLYLMGIGLLAIAGGLVLGFGTRGTEDL